MPRFFEDQIMLKNKLKPIRSFVQRAGRMTPGQERALQELYTQFSPANLEVKINLTELFGREAERVLEIGFGMGQSLLQQAEHFPQQDFLGVEVHRPGIGSLLAGIENQQLSNVRVICADAVEILRTAIEDSSFDRIQIFFPDPWPKTRHHKRRIIQAEFVSLLVSKLKNNGILHLATDWQDYAEQMLKVLSAENQLTNLAGENQFSPRPAERPLTKFELRGQRLGHGIWDLLFCRNPTID